MKLGVIMDPISGINIKKDSTFAMLLAAQKRGWEIHYMEIGDISFRDNQVLAEMHRLSVTDDPGGWFDFTGQYTLALADLDIILMRKDPPFNVEYIYTTHLLDHACKAGVLVVNNPDSLRDANEKLFLTHFPQCAPPTLVSRDAGHFRTFLADQKDIVIKPLDGMGGSSVFRVHSGDHNIGVIIETLTDHGRKFAMAQKYIPEITEGDKRILMINGEPVDYALARIPSQGETRGNLAVGGTGKGVELTERDRWICSQVGPELRERGLYFAGLDVIGDYLTEINVTSPTCIRELDQIYNINIGDMLMDSLETIHKGH